MNRPNLLDFFRTGGVPTADGFCFEYHKVIRAKGDGNIKANRQVRDRILANEERFRCECEKICRAK